MVTIKWESNYTDDTGTIDIDISEEEAEQKVKELNNHWENTYFVYSIVKKDNERQT